MIHTVVATLVGELNTYLKQSQGTTDGEFAILSNLVDQAGNLDANSDEQLLCHLVNLEQENSHLNSKPLNNHRSNRPIDLNLYLLFASHANSHFAALQQLSSVITFFQGKRVFTPRNTPGFTGGTEKVTAEICNLNFQELNNLWGALGTKALPSVVMKFRMISNGRDLIQKEITEVKTIDL